MSPSFKYASPSFKKPRCLPNASPIRGTTAGCGLGAADATVPAVPTLPKLYPQSRRAAASGGDVLLFLLLLLFLKLPDGCFDGEFVLLAGVDIDGEENKARFAVCACVCTCTPELGVMG